MDKMEINNKQNTEAYQKIQKAFDQCWDFLRTIDDGGTYQYGNFRCKVNAECKKDGQTHFFRSVQHPFFTIVHGILSDGNHSISFEGSLEHFFKIAEKMSAITKSRNEHAMNQRAKKQQSHLSL